MRRWSGLSITAIILLIIHRYQCIFPVGHSSHLRIIRSNGVDFDRFSQLLIAFRLLPFGLITHQSRALIQLLLQVSIEWPEILGSPRSNSVAGACVRITISTGAFLRFHKWIVTHVDCLRSHDLVVDPYGRGSYKALALLAALNFSDLNAGNRPSASRS